ncbi:MAG: complex I NDUFA9 subunit family protein [Deinococcales bacterium]
MSQGQKITVTGATGYVGHHVVRELLERGHQVSAVSRSGAKSSTASGKTLATFESVNYIGGDVVTGRNLDQAFAGAEVVIHLVGIIAEHRDQTFQNVHINGTKNVLEAAKKAGVKRYLHMSALGAQANAASGYSSSKFAAEELVRASGLDYTIFRPSLIFGEGDDFFGRVLKNLVSSAPIVPQIGDGSFPFRPVWVGDVAKCFAQSLDIPATIGQVYNVVGAQEFSFRELLLLEMKALGIKKPLVPAPIFLMDIAVPMMQILGSLAPITTHQYAMLKAGNTADPAPVNAVFKLENRSLESELPKLLGK